MIDTKYQAVEYFRFLCKICARGGCANCNEKSCGVLFFADYAYSVNTDIIGVIKIYDNFPVINPVFWSYGREKEIDQPSKYKFMLNFKAYVDKNPVAEIFKDMNFINRLDHYLNKAVDNSFFVRKNDLLSRLNRYDLSAAKQNKMKVQIQTGCNGIKVILDPIKRTKAMNYHFTFSLHYFVYPGTYQKLRINGDTCVVNMLNFYEIITRGFEEYQIIRIKYSEHGPVIVEGRAKNKGEIFFALSQIY